MNFPVVAVVTAIHFSDARVNPSAAVNPDQRGSYAVADVVVLNDGTDTPWVIPKVTILPPGASGVDDFHEELPTPTTGMVDGSKYSTDLVDVDPTKMNGDWCVVQFIGGFITQPIMTHWFPHPSNNRDVSTGGAVAALGSRALPQGHRLFKRFAGAKVTVTPTGSIYLDTEEAGALLDPKGSFTRKNKDIGGDIKVSVKDSRQFEVNFNKQVALPRTEPALPQANPPKSTEDGVRDDVFTRLTMDKDFVQAVAGQVIELISGSMYLGTKDTANENFVLGQRWKALMDSILEKLIGHTHPTAFGPSGSSVELFEDFTVKRQSLDDQLSDWIFGQKEPPK